jgi:hypothetical protein
LADAKIFFIESDRPVTKKNGAGGIWRMDNHGLRKKGGGQGAQIPFPHFYHSGKIQHYITLVIDNCRTRAYITLCMF